jgi:predicted LPLAT superfamily acyltransferase
LRRREGGNRFWLLFIRWVILHLGRPVTRFCLIFATGYFWMRRPVERRASRAWLARALGRDVGNWAVLRHIYTFATVLADRAALLAGRQQRFAMRIEGVEELHEDLAQGRGAILIGSHLGSFEVMRVLGANATRHRLWVVMDQQLSERMSRVMDALNPGIAATIINARQPGPQVALQIHDALAAGDMVAMLGDRAHAGDPGLAVEFCGQPARFPGTPLSMAMVANVPVTLVFGLFEGGNRYRLVFERFALQAPATRSERLAVLREATTRYAQRLSISPGCIRSTGSTSTISGTTMRLAEPLNNSRCCHPGGSRGPS